MNNLFCWVEEIREYMWKYEKQETVFFGILIYDAGMYHIELKVKNDNEKLKAHECVIAEQNFRNISFQDAQQWVENHIRIFKEHVGIFISNENLQG